VNRISNFVALLLLDRCEASIRPEEIGVLAGVSLQSSGNELIDVEHSPVEKTTSTHISN
jgi:hypothetical protein